MVILHNLTVRIMKIDSQNHHLVPYSCMSVDSSTWKCGQPLTVDGCLVMLCLKGKAEFSVSSRSVMLRPYRMALITYDMVTVPLGFSDDFNAVCLCISFSETQDIFFLITSNRFWEFVFKSTVFSVPSPLHGLVANWFATLEWIQSNSGEEIRYKIMRNEAENFMHIMADQLERNLGQLGPNPAKNRAWVLANDFIALLTRHYTKHHDVAYYAGRLSITPNYLNIINRRYFGTTAKEQINIQLGLVVKNLLHTTDLTVKEISERLHFDDPSYLCRIFKKQTGMTPLQFRNRMRD